jgi:hypothetical protein
MIRMIRTIISKMMRWTRHVVIMVEMGYAYRVLIGKPEAGKPLCNLEVDRRI